MFVAIGIGAAAVVGVIVILLGLRGVRVDDHPLCARCGFDLHGLGSGAGCPECGAGVGTPGRRGRAPVRIGNRRRVKGAIGAGAVILLLVAIGVGVLFWAAAAKVNL